jgi:hypothetical protein
VGRAGRRLVDGEPLEPSGQLGPGEVPGERTGLLIRERFVQEQPRFDLREIGEGVGGEDLALDDREVDLSEPILLHLP